MKKIMVLLAIIMVIFSSPKAFAWGEEKYGGSYIVIERPYNNYRHHYADERMKELRAREKYYEQQLRRERATIKKIKKKQRKREQQRRRRDSRCRYKERRSETVIERAVERAVSDIIRATGRRVERDIRR